MHHGYVPGIIPLQVIRDGIPQLVSTVPLRTGILRCTCFSFSSVETLFVYQVIAYYSSICHLLVTTVSNGRDIQKGNAGIDAGLEDSFSSFEETSLVVLNLRCEGEMEGRLQSEPMGG